MGFFAPSHDEIVWFYVPMNEVFPVDELYPLDHLIPDHHSRFEVKFFSIHYKQVLKRLPE